MRSLLLSEEAASGNGGCFHSTLEKVPGAVTSKIGQEACAGGVRVFNGTTVLAPVPGAVVANPEWDAKKKRPRSNRSEAYFRAACELQGLPEGFDLPPFKVEEKIRAVGNGVPYPLARAVARAVREATS